MTKIGRINQGSDAGDQTSKVLKTKVPGGINNESKAFKETKWGGID